MKQAEEDSQENTPLVPVSWETIERLTLELAIHIHADGVPDLLIGFQRGGLIPAVLLSHHLKIAEMVALPVRRTTSDKVYAPKQEPSLFFPAQLGQRITNRDVLLVDDIAGSGGTLQAVQAAVLAAHPCRLRSAVCLVNLAHWEPIHAYPPTEKITYIGQTIRAWAVFPWERAKVLITSSEK